MSSDQFLGETYKVSNIKYIPSRCLLTSEEKKKDSFSNKLLYLLLSFTHEAQRGSMLLRTRPALRKSRGDRSNRKNILVGGECSHHSVDPCWSAKKWNSVTLGTNLSNKRNDYTQFLLTGQQLFPIWYRAGDYPFENCCFFIHFG